jgi:hypothetical protein
LKDPARRHVFFDLIDDHGTYVQLVDHRPSAQMDMFDPDAELAAIGVRCWQVIALRDQRLTMLLAARIEIVRGDTPTPFTETDAGPRSRGAEGCAAA